MIIPADVKHYVAPLFEFLFRLCECACRWLGDTWNRRTTYVPLAAMTRKPKKASKDTEGRFGALVRAARKRAGLTQDELANKSGLSTSMVSAVEQSKVPNPSLTTILHLEAALRPHLDITSLLEPAPAADALDAWFNSPMAKGLNVTESEAAVMRAVCYAVYPKADVPDEAWAQALLTVRSLFR